MPSLRTLRIPDEPVSATANGIAVNPASYAGRTVKRAWRIGRQLHVRLDGQTPVTLVFPNANAYEACLKRGS